MTDKIMEARRAAFEHEYSKLDQQAAEHLLFIRDDGQYGYHTTRVAWACFNAALDSLCVELPAELHAKPYACYEGGWNDMRAEVADILEFQGIKTK